MQVRLEPLLTHLEEDPIKFDRAPTTLLPIQQLAAPAITAAELDILPVIVVAETHQTTKIRDATVKTAETILDPTTPQLITFALISTVGLTTSAAVMVLAPFWHKVIIAPHPATQS